MKKLDQDEKRGQSPLLGSVLSSSFMALTLQTDHAVACPIARVRMGRAACPASICRPSRKTVSSTKEKNKSIYFKNGKPHSPERKKMLFKNKPVNSRMGSKERVKTQPKGNTGKPTQGKDGKSPVGGILSYGVNSS